MKHIIHPLINSEVKIQQYNNGSYGYWTPKGWRNMKSDHGKMLVKNFSIHIVSESPSEVKLINHGWQKLTNSIPEIGEHEGVKGVYLKVDGFSDAHTMDIEDFR